MTFQEQFLRSAPAVETLFRRLGCNLVKYSRSGPPGPCHDLTRGEFEDGNGRRFGWCAMINDYPLCESEPAGLMLRFLSCDENVPAGLVSDWVENEEQFREFTGRNFPAHAA
jgi:hypothetical protein